MLSDHDLKMLAQQRLAEAPKEGDRYQHYKGDYYRVLSTSIKEDDLTPLVTYRSEKLQVNWTRTLKNWQETVEHNGETVPRFKKVSNDE